jgi:hypothetical protein
MTRLVYACRFEIPSAPTLEPVLTAYREWIERRYRNGRGITDFTCDLSLSGATAGLPNGHSLKSNHYASDLGHATSIEWSHPADSDATLRWRNDIRIGAFPSHCSVDHQVWIESIDYQVSPAQFLLGSPGVIRRLCSEQTVKVGEMEIRATPYSLEEPGVVDFLTLLRSPLRKLPIVFLAPYATGDFS